MEVPAQIIIAVLDIVASYVVNDILLTIQPLVRKP